MADQKKQQFQNRKHIPTDVNQAGAVVLEAALRKVAGEKAKEKTDLNLVHKQKGILSVVFDGTKDDLDTEAIVDICNDNLVTEWEGKTVDLQAFFITGTKIKRGKLELSFSVADAAKAQIQKRSGKKKTEGKNKKAGKDELRLQARSIADAAIEDIVAEALGSLKSNGVSLPEGKALDILKDKLTKDLRPSVLIFQNLAYAQGHASAMGTQQPPPFNLYDK
mmetsp:Transcript_11341/g.15844  ORF Transcript_11341/g.15844 Transcript_11341/m.15844 type:complete len:221 (-) Transcript_11341:81-743(-)|eukprot:CAMPEP_0184488832 /NCGR_PEP_ID=MMETSP0113_2-20130426/13607_1 /TAXON_ID=91329 /ORGANISM="Norrisiella sphaerica, Strain BC52" /LENGTH=220 /DNA_ID=CAMNT_0026871893 /DNA_START=137 /DNA_END=799 /DNA_ORIENTATION=+